MKTKCSNTTWCLLAGVLFTTACRISKDTTAPADAMPAGYRGLQEDTANVAGVAWRDFFSDTTLTALVTEALAHNFDLQVALKNIDAASLEWQQARLGNIPVLGAGVTVLTNRPSDNSLTGLNLKQLQASHYNDYTAGASLSWEADLWGKIRSRKAEALAAFLQTEEARKAIQVQIVSDIAKGYYNLLMLDAQLAIARKNVRLNDSTLSIIQWQYEAGQVSSLAVDQAKAQQLTAAALVPQFEQGILIQENAISLLSGRAPAAVARTAKQEWVTRAEKAGAGWPVALLSYRPDVKRAELALSKANAAVGVAKAGMYPSFTISAQAGVNAIKASNWFNLPASLFGNALAGLSQPLFQQKKQRTQYEVAAIKRDQSVILFRQTVLTAVGEVSDALARIEKLRQQQAYLAEKNSTLEHAMANAQSLFKNGLATYLEVITAQGSILQSELELVTIKKQQLDAAVDLYRSVGGGWN